MLNNVASIINYIIIIMSKKNDVETFPEKRTKLQTNTHPLWHNYTLCMLKGGCGASI